MIIRGGKQVEYREQKRAKKKEKGVSSENSVGTTGGQSSSQVEDLENEATVRMSSDEWYTDNNSEGGGEEAEDTVVGRERADLEQPDSTTEQISVADSEEAFMADREQPGASVGAGGRAQGEAELNGGSARRGDNGENGGGDRPKKRESPWYTMKVDFFLWKRNFLQWIDRWEVRGKHRVFEMMESITNEEAKLKPKSLKRQLCEIVDKEGFYEKEDYFGFLMDSMERMIYGESWERMKTRVCDLFKWERPQGMDIEDFIDEFQRRLQEMQRATGKELDCKLKIIWLLVTCRVKQMVWIDITNVMMDKEETDWWDITLRRLRSHYRASIEKETRKSSFEEVNAAVNYYARTRGRGVPANRGRGFSRGRGFPPKNQGNERQIPSRDSMGSG